MLKKPRTIPTHPGVYIFWNKKTPLYVGKAANLKNRVSSYFKKDAGWKVAQLRTEATRLEFMKADSEIEALIRESELIKRYRAKFNVLMRDDKNYLYIALTKEEFPRFFFTHQPERGMRAIGPFTEGYEVRNAMKLLRRSFPYCTCRRPHRGTCVNSQIGKCPGYCCIKERPADPEERAHYAQNIHAVLDILSGKRNAIVKNLKKLMREASLQQKYEEAARLRDQIYGLEAFYRHRGIAKSSRQPHSYHKVERVLQSLFGVSTPIRRIEGYDISHIAGSDSTGSMVVFSDGQPDRAQYRKFKIKRAASASDTDAHREVLIRRLLHSEWEYPDLVVIDGGIAQLNAIKPLLNRKGYRRILLSALAKPPRKFFSRAPSGMGYNEDVMHIAGKVQPVRIKSLPPDAAHLLQRIRDESHRFARNYHHLLRKKSLHTSRT